MVRRCSRGIDESIAAAAFGDQAGPCWIIIELLADLRRTDAQMIDVLDIAAPDLVQDDAVGDQLTRMLGENRKEAELGGTQPDRASTDGNAAPRTVDDEVSDREHSAARYDARSRRRSDNGQRRHCSQRDW